MHTTPPIGVVFDCRLWPVVDVFEERYNPAFQANRTSRYLRRGSTFGQQFFGPCSVTIKRVRGARGHR